MPKLSQRVHSFKSQGQLTRWRYKRRKRDYKVRNSLKLGLSRVNSGAEKINMLDSTVGEYKGQGEGKSLCSVKEHSKKTKEQIVQEEIAEEEELNLGKQRKEKLSTIEAQLYTNEDWD
ncbi:hypothetical protein Tco_0625480 [Tanacetum coccineum]|uniref:Uncharacterized protein n=1 Tax=Tanacetum coccineum TaxID=301880 RepID=A0ABQ4WH03_9ASTR